MSAKRAGVYGRNSKGEAKSIEDQLALGEQVVRDTDGWTLAGTYSDDSSASEYRDRDREDWPKLVAAVLAGLLDVLVVWKMARGSRDELDWVPLLRDCRARGVLIHVVADRRTYDPRDARDWKTLYDEAGNASYYSQQLSADVRRGVDQAAAGGGPHGRAPFGYDYAYDEHRRPLRVPNAHLDAVREIFKRLDKRDPIITITDDLRERGVPAPSGVGWHRNAVRVIARNRAYVGIRRHRGVDYPAQWPAAVDEDVFWRVQAILDEQAAEGGPGDRAVRPGAAKHLLTYLVATPCGSTLNRRAARHEGGNDRLACLRDGCVTVLLPDLDEVVGRIVVARLGRRDARALYARNDEQTRAAEADLARYERQLEEARASFESVDGISAEALARKERALAPLIAEARERARPVGIGGVLDELMNAPDRAARWAALGIPAKRSVIRFLAELRLGPPTRRLSRWSDRDDRLGEALVRLDGSRWAGDRRTWGELRG